MVDPEGTCVTPQEQLAVQQVWERMVYGTTLATCCGSAAWATQFIEQDGYSAWRRLMHSAKESLRCETELMSSNYPRYMNLGNDGPANVDTVTYWKAWILWLEANEPPTR